MTHSHRCDMNSTHPDREILQHRRRPGRRQRRRRDARHQQRSHCETKRVDRDGRSAAEQRDRHAGTRGPQRKRAAARGSEQRVRGLQLLGLDHLRNEADERRRMKREREAVADHQRNEQRHRRVTADERNRDRRLTGHRDQIRGNHHAPPRHAVRDDAAEQQAHDLCGGLTRDHHAGRTRRPGQM